LFIYLFERESMSWEEVRGRGRGGFPAERGAHCGA